jgi:hypothetical protein
MSTSNSSNSKRETSDSKIAAGLSQNQASLPALMILGKTYTVADAVTVLQSRIAKTNATVANKAAWQASVQAENLEIAATKAFVSALTQQLHVWFANAPDALAAYGLVPKKVSGPKTVVTKVLAVAKRLATRAARHTMGSVERLSVKGNIPATISIAAPPGSAQVQSAVTVPVVASEGPSVNASHGASPVVPSNGSAPKSP